MSGFGYLVSEIVICLLLAAALGFLIGWLWRALISDRKAEEANRDWAGRLGRTEARYRNLDDKLRAAEEEHAQARAEYETSLAALKGDLEGGAEASDAPSKELEEAQEKSQALEDELESLQGQLAQCEESNASRQAEVDTLRGELEASREAGAGGQEDDAKLVALQASVEEQTQLHDKAKARIADLEKELAACQEAQAEEGLSAPETAAPLLAAAVAAGTTNDALEAQLAEKDQQILQLEQQLAAMDKLAGESLEPDDLQRIKGIGPVLERMLNGVGVFTFRQIAAWDAADIAWAAAKLDAFSDRIERDEWVIQARDFYREKLKGES